MGASTVMTAIIQSQKAEIEKQRAHFKEQQRREQEQRELAEKQVEKTPEIQIVAQDLALEEIKNSDGTIVYRIKKD